MSDDEKKRGTANENFKDKLDSGIDTEKLEKLRQIELRHLTEYAKNQKNDFSSVLGLPEITAE